MTGADGVDASPQRPEAVLVLGDREAADVLRDVRRRLPFVLVTSPDTVVLDLSRTSELSSATVAAILWTKRRCRARGTDVVLRRPSRRDVDLLRRCGLGDAITATGGAATHPDAARGEGRRR